MGSAAGGKGVNEREGYEGKREREGLGEGGRGERGRGLRKARQVALQAMELPLQGCLKLLDYVWISTKLDLTVTSIISDHLLLVVALVGKVHQHGTVSKAITSRCQKVMIHMALSVHSACDTSFGSTETGIWLVLSGCVVSRRTESKPYA